MNMKEAIAKATDRIDRGQSRDDFPRRWQSTATAPFLQNPEQEMY